MESWSTRIARKCFSSWRTSVFKLILLHLYLSFLFRSRLFPSIALYLKTDCWFLNILNFDLFIGIGILIGQKSQECFKLGHISKFELKFLGNYSFEILHKILNWRFHTTTCFLLWKSLLLFLGLAWILPSRSPSTTFFFNNWVSLLKSIFVCSIYHFCAALTENIAVRLCLLLT